MNRDDVLVHGEYDPVKAHEYYMRTRELKGRRKASSSIGTKTATSTGTTKIATSKRKADSKSVTAVRVAALKIRLAKLKEVLESLQREAKARSGVEPKRETKPADAKGPARSTRPSTSVEKAKAAKEARERYEKLNPEQSLKDEIASVEAKIAKARERLSQAVGRARATATRPSDREQ